MARCLIIACGCRGLALARELIAEGHAVRATTRQTARLGVLEAAGTEPVLADPDRVGTLVPALEHVALAYILLGSASGPPAALAELHSSRLEMLLSKMLDSTVRAIVYEAAGTVPHGLLAAGAGLLTAFGADAHVPVTVLEAEPARHGAWLAAAQGAARTLL